MKIVNHQILGNWEPSTALPKLNSTSFSFIANWNIILWPRLGSQGSKTYLKVWMTTAHHKLSFLSQVYLETLFYMLINNNAKREVSFLTTGIQCDFRCVISDMKSEIYNLKKCSKVLGSGYLGVSLCTKCLLYFSS